jgi:two-component system, NtrC family, sensor kinase
MRRRSRAGGESPNAQAPKAAARKSRIAPKARPSGSSAAGKETRVARLTRALNESLEQQTATSEILRVISNSKTDIQPVFEAIAASAMRLCDAVNSLVIRFDGRLMHLVAHHNVIPERLDTLERLFPLPPSRASVSGRSILSRVALQVEDITLDREYMLPTATTFGYRTERLVNAKSLRRASRPFAAGLF